MKNNETGGYFIMIPQAVYGNKDISPRAALVFGLILSLANGKTGYCYAANKYLADLMNVSERTISGCLAELKREKLITIQVGMNKETRTIYRRITTFWTKPKPTNKSTKKTATEPEWLNEYLEELKREEESL